MFVEFKTTTEIAACVLHDFAAKGTLPVVRYLSYKSTKS